MTTAHHLTHRHTHTYTDSSELARQLKTEVGWKVLCTNMEEDVCVCVCHMYEHT